MTQAASTYDQARRMAEDELEIIQSNLWTNTLTDRQADRVKASLINAFLTPLFDGTRMGHVEPGEREHDSLPAINHIGLLT